MCDGARGDGRLAAVATARPLVAVASLLIAVSALTGCGGHGSQTTTHAQPPLRVVVYFYRDGKLRPVARRVTPTGGRAAAALKALADGPPAGYATALPRDADPRVAVDEGHAKVALHEELDERAAAQVVFTLTRLPTIRAVSYDDGTRERSGLDRRAFVALAPPILVESPLPGDRVATPVVVRGTASVFEATLVVELLQGGSVAVRRTVTASTGAPETGTFETTLAGGARGPAQVVAFSPSAADGSEQHKVSVPVRITP
jgi:immunoglobulin-like protein involved in spore germination/sporulation and spore germination protein